MKPYHKACGSVHIGKADITTGRGKYERRTTVNVCLHCGRSIEDYEVYRVDKRLSAVIFKGKSYIHGRECK